MKRRSLLVPLLCGLPAACHAAAAPAAFQPEALSPYFTEGPAAQGLVRLRAGEPAEAVKLFSQHLQTPKAAHAPQARFLLGLAQLRAQQSPPVSKETPAAAQTFAALQKEKDLGLLGDYLGYYGARSLFLADQDAAALQRLARLTPDGVLRCPALFLQAQAEVKLGQSAPAAQDLQRYLATCPGGQNRTEARAVLAGLHEKQRKPQEAIAEWRQLYLSVPTEPQGAQAERALEAAGGAAMRFSASELLGRAMVLFDNMRNPESEVAFRAILDMPDVTPPDRCAAQFHLAQSVFKQRQRPRAAPLFDTAIAVCGGANGAPAIVPDLHMKALYQGARCHASRGELQAAADLFARAEAEHPEHSFADDARLRQAEMYADLAEKLRRDGPQKACAAAACPDYEAKIKTLLGELPQRFPSGDQRAEALFRLAFRAFLQKNEPAAQAALQESLKIIPREVGWDQEGRTLYWLGRLAERAGQRDAALASYQRVAREYPLTYYALLALNRLRQGFPAELDALLAELTRDPPGEDPAFHFPPRPLYGTPGFQRGVELVRLGLLQEAQREFLAAGLPVPEGKGKGEKLSPEKEELYWLAAVVFDRAGDWHRSHWIPRHTLTAYQRRYPVGAARREWLLSYPRGYADLLTAAAQKNGQPEALQFAIVREESAFDPLNESFANAIGLTQMIPPTAKRFSGGLPTTREALRDPATNVAIGARFLGFLWSTMQGHPALTISGYNAGEGAVFRWLRERGNLDLDAFVETIPFDETRGYTKRVLSSFLVYRWLQPGTLAPRDRVPELNFTLPNLPARR